MPVQASYAQPEIRDNTLYNSYNIPDSNPDEKYIISIDKKDEDGNTIREDVPTQNLRKEDLEPDDGTRDIDPEEETKKPELPAEIKTKDFNRTGIVIQSLAFPGLGLSRVTGNPHWLRGVAGYGCIAGSIVLNRQAVSTFNTIEGLENVDDVNEAFDKSVHQDNISEVLAYAAIGIWVADIIWTVAGTSDLKKRPLDSQSKRFSIKSDFDPVSNIPMISLRYRF